jgi:tetratricopeptide (TPR) repeat protein
MNRKKKLKHFLVTALLLIIPIFIIGGVIYYDELSDAKMIFEIQAIDSLKGQAEQIIDEFTYIVSDLLFLAEQNELQIFLEAIQAAIEMLESLTQYNTTRGRLERPIIRLGIGLNAGPLMLGIIGGTERMDSTVVSDTVNLASRVEGLTKFYGVTLLITEQTYSKLIDPSQYHIRIIDVVKVKGKSKAITVYEVYDANPPTEVILKDQTRYDFEQGFTLYHQGDFELAKSFFERVLHVNEQDEAARIYLARCVKQM